MKDVYGKAKKILQTQAFVEWLNKWKLTATELGWTHSNDVSKECIETLDRLLVEHNLGNTWKIPLLKSLYLDSIDVPIGEGIHIEVGGKPITQESISSGEIEIDANKRHLGVHVVITKQATMGEIKSFLKENEFLLHNLFKNLDLPESTKEGKELLLPYVVAVLKDNKGMTYPEIATFLCDAYANDGYSKDFLEKFNEKYLQKIYSEFKQKLHYKK